MTLMASVRDEIYERLWSVAYARTKGAVGSEVHIQAWMDLVIGRRNAVPRSLILVEAAEGPLSTQEGQGSE